MNKKRMNTIINIISVLLLAAVLICYSEMPDTIPAHWDSTGAVNRWTGKSSIFKMWALVPGLDIIMRFAEKIDPKGENYKRFESIFLYFRLGMALFMSSLVVITIIASFDKDLIDMNKIMFPLMGLAFIALGNYMPKIKHNYTFGIKTPHTLASENVWNKTHRMAGPLWMAMGVFMTACAFLKGDIVVWVILGASLVACFLPMVYAYFEYKKEKGE